MVAIIGIFSHSWQFAINSHVTLRYGEKYRNGEETIWHDNQEVNILQCLEISYRWMT